MNETTQRLIEYVVAQTGEFLKFETGITVDSITYDFGNVKKLHLKHITSMMAVEGPFQVIFAFSFDGQLSVATTKAYTIELEPDEDVIENYLEETAADIINIVLGNVLVHFQIAGRAIELTPPIVLTEAKTIYRKKPAQFLTAELSTILGKMQVFCIGPKELFDEKLNYKEASPKC